MKCLLHHLSSMKSFWHHRSFCLAWSNHSPQPIYNLSCKLLLGLRKMSRPCKVQRLLKLQNLQISSFHRTSEQSILSNHSFRIFFLTGSKAPCSRPEMINSLKNNLSIKGIHQHLNRHFESLEASGWSRPDHLLTRKLVLQP